MPYSVVIGLLIVCALISLGCYIGFYKTPKHSHTFYSKLWRITLLATLGAVVIILIALPILIIQNA